ncbi:MAG: hypothetical protein EOO15_01875 [Chitinophagaceae bacterium]|nr:MAG: hypothetical protein EOO15_01875 [Chitinophagaceae bacterium]
MKKLLFLLLSAPLFASAQDCTMLRRDRDPYTKEVRINTGQMLVGNGHKLSVEATAKEIDIFFVLSANGACFNDQSTMVTNFTGTRTRSTYKNAGTMNCEGFFHIIFRNGHEPVYGLKKLLDQKVSAFTFGEGKDALVITLTEEQKEILQRSLSCLVNEAKGLLPPPVQ